MPRLIKNKTYQIKYKDETEFFFAYFIQEDRGFLCFNHAGRVIACRPENIEIRDTIAKSD